ncbi:hypothetical protein PUNSTDRAFT_44396 [Punctularia strigosozonata HHB-11173 SS5]|uniref:uncharacterized protein n=1 Tax=Punctularia strigosozonata (strain HHB-11173) TaxID=741275 RepID=UPI0004418064|nr:uncharacterized protein PUNSTDRAFT_44396 [Punctularia strigosozonata HHB-11173 SS5]EIN08877.1 hypothetical protein PUNSTDRAFT_44396 [Punctularia strigosozonata HHB-11173 SS5]
MLPPEILGFIIEKLDDEVDVRACTLTCQRMLPHARTSFWRRMTLVKDEHVRTVLDMLDHIPEIARYIRKLHVHTYLFQSGPPTAPPVGKDGTTQNHMRDLLLQLTYLDELALASLSRGTSEHEAKIHSTITESHLYTLSSILCSQNVGVVSLTGCIFASLHDLMTALGSFPRLSALRMDNVTLDLDAPEDDSVPGSTLIDLRSLDMRPCPWNPKDLTHLFYRCLGSRPALSMQRLFIDYSVERHWNALRGLLDNLPQLEHLAFSAPIYPSKQPMTELVNLGRCAQLRSLSLRVPINLMVQRPICATWVSQLLDTAQSPLLERVTISVEYWNDSCYYQVLLWDDIDDILADSRRFPHLQEVTILPCTPQNDPDHISTLVDSQTVLLPLISDRGILHTVPQLRDAF